MFSRQKPQQIFASALALLLFSGLASGFTIYKLYTSEEWVRHTYQVELDTRDIEASLAKAGRLRQTYLDSGETKYLDDLGTVRRTVFEKLADLRALTHDNRDQQSRLGQLEVAIRGRFKVIEESVQARKQGPVTAEQQLGATSQIVTWAFETARLTEEMDSAEEALLDRRMGFTARLFLGICAIFAATFLLSIYLFSEYYRLLAEELKERTKAEAQARRLSGEVLRAQDEERRRISRELHDGLGQMLVGAKMLVDSFAREAPSAEVVEELSGLLAEAVSATRTISHLLHPPMLDEIGFLSAARWLVEGFSKRAGIAVTQDIPEDGVRLVAATELTLFRVLQESLMNVQKHSGSQRATVRVRMDASKVSIEIQDFGCGLPPETLERFAGSGTGVGVGLAGMKQRVLELSGSFAVISGTGGTTVSVTMPMEAQNKSERRGEL